MDIFMKFIKVVQQIYKQLLEHVSNAKRVIKRLYRRGELYTQ